MGGSRLIDKMDQPVARGQLRRGSIPAPLSSRLDAVLELQRLAGNAAVTQLLRRWCGRGGPTPPSSYVNVQRLEQTEDGTVWSESLRYAVFVPPAPLLGVDKQHLPRLTGVHWQPEGEGARYDGRQKRRHGWELPRWRPTLDDHVLRVPKDCVTTAELVAAWITKTSPRKIGVVEVKPSIKVANKDTSLGPGDILFHVHTKSAGDFHAASVIAKDGNDAVTMEADASKGEQIASMAPLFDMYAGHRGFHEEQSADATNVRGERTYVIHFDVRNTKQSLWGSIQEDIREKKYTSAGAEAANGIIRVIEDAVKEEENLEGMEIEEEKTIGASETAASSSSSQPTRRTSSRKKTNQ